MAGMKPPLRIRKLETEEYHALKKWAASRTMAAGRVKRAQIILLSNRFLFWHRRIALRTAE